MLFYRSIIMLDLRFVRENPEIVKQNIRNKFQDSKLPLVDEVIELDKQNRATKQEADSLRAERNKISKQIGGLMAQGKKDEAAALREKHISRTRQMAKNVGKETTLGTFLNSRYPEK